MTQNTKKTRHRANQRQLKRKKGRKQPVTTDFFVQMEIEISYGQFTCKP